MSSLASRDRARQPREGGQPPLFLVTGLVLGLGLGLLIAWLLWPAGAGSIDPGQLSDIAKDQYRTSIALAYAASGDLGRAEARLELLGDNDPARALRNQAQLALLEPEAQRQARALSQLADALDGAAIVTLEAGAEATPTATAEEEGDG